MNANGPLWKPRAKRWGRRAGAVGVAGLVSGCQVPPLPEDAGFFNRAYEDLPTAPSAVATEQVVTLRPIGRQEVMARARDYATHPWTPTQANVRHGFDAQGVRVETPDAGFSQPGIRPGWWLPGVENRGMPYKWGGFSSIEAFDEGIAAGLAAGDVLTPSKRQQAALGERTISQEAVGIDSSGFVSRCWDLSRALSTRELPMICEPVAYEDLRAGDILNLEGIHVLLFHRFANASKGALLAYEAGSPPSWKVLYDYLPVAPLKRLGYRGWRYREIVDDLPEAEAPRPPVEVVPPEGGGPLSGPEEDPLPETPEAPLQEPLPEA